jgi:c-di-AMP phosphodiesterase-like protein
LNKEVGQNRHAKYFIRFGKASKVRKIVLEIDNYYDVQRPEKDNNVSNMNSWTIKMLETKKVTLFH